MSHVALNATLQVMMYRTLLGNFADSCSAKTAAALFTMHGLDPKRSLGKPVSTAICSPTYAVISSVSANVNPRFAAPWLTDV